MVDFSIQVFQEQTLDDMFKPEEEWATQEARSLEKCAISIAEENKKFRKHFGFTDDRPYSEQMWEISPDKLHEYWKASEKDYSFEDRFPEENEKLTGIVKKGTLDKGILKIKTLCSTGFRNDHVLRLVYITAAKVQESKNEKELLNLAHYGGEHNLENVFYFCTQCMGYIKGDLTSECYDTPCMGLAGGSGTSYGCKRCGEGLAHHSMRCA